jgi:putative ABC transport system substrate-binding protein
MKRREFIALLGGAVAAWPLAARAQQPQHTTKLLRIGVLAGYPLPPLLKFSQKLKELGYVEGRLSAWNIALRKGMTTRWFSV